jgi:hypothetical protein
MAESNLEGKLRKAGIGPEAAMHALEAQRRMYKLYGITSGTMSGDSVNIDLAAEIIGYIADNCGNLAGLRALDIGCGTNDTRSGDGWKPWTAPGLSLMWADVTGIDLFESPGETYNHIRADLVKQSLSEVVGDRKYNIIICNSFIDSPTRGDIVSKAKKGNPDYSQTAETIKFLKEIPTLMTPGGILVVDTTGLKHADLRKIAKGVDWRGKEWWNVAKITTHQMLNEAGFSLAKKYPHNSVYRSTAGGEVK